MGYTEREQRQKLLEIFERATAHWFVPVAKRVAKPVPPEPPSEAHKAELARLDAAFARGEFKRCAQVAPGKYKVW